METNITTEYLQLTREYQEKYGKNTILLMQVGAFFEVYGLKNPTTGEITRSQILEFSQICQLNVSEKKNYVDGDTVVMAGFRDYSLEKYIQKISENGYTGVVYIQEKDGKNVTRKFHAVYSAGTYVSYETEQSPKITNNIMCIWMEKYKSIHKTAENLICGISVVNIFTGKSFLFEYQVPYYANPTTYDELERCISIYNPSEVIMVTPFDENTLDSIIQYTNIRASTIHKFSLNSVNSKNETAEILKRCSQQKYINHILDTFYEGCEVYNTCNEFQDHTIATQSFCYLLHFIQEHNANLVKKIDIPKFNNTSHRMVLANHTLKQLNILNDSSDDGQKMAKYSSVLTFLNKCCTPMGRREFQIQMTNPNFYIKWLNKEYEMIGILLNTENIHFISLFRKQFPQICDIEKLARQLVLRKIYPSSVYQLYKSLEIIQQIYVCLLESKCLNHYFRESDSQKTPKSADLLEQCSQLSKFIKGFLKIEECKNVDSIQNFDENIILPGISKTLDDIIAKYEKSQNHFHEIRNFLNQLLRTEEKNSDIEYVKIHETEKSGSSLQITKKRGVLLKTLLAKVNGPLKITEDLEIDPKEIQFKNASTTNSEIEIPVLEKICKNIYSLKERINQEIAAAYNDFLAKFESMGYDTLEKIAKSISKMDVLQSKAYIAKEYNYVSPEIDATAEVSFVNAYDLRHCLIEHIQQNELYVPNDVLLGNIENRGMLLYGTNAVGKTSMIRALGISVIMAQCGMYVPCSRFVYYPYKSIYSRILGNDNIFKGLSTFAVEMSELRIILRNADEYSLILGDELCSGTETESALSIFCAGLMHLNAINASYIFATHFHEILQYEEIKQMSKVSIKHMAVKFDRELDTLVYDRKLRDGAGNRMYGLEVCKSLYLPDEFLTEAYKIRNKYYPINQGNLSHDTTVYNARKIRGICEMCNVELGEETHHLVKQKDADQNGFVGSFHKNHPGNLLTVCEKCHLQLHSTNMPNKVRKKTNTGYILETTK